MARRVEFETTVKSGLPVIARAYIYDAEPDVGCPQDWAEVDELRWIGGKEVSHAVYDAVTKDDWERIQEEAMSA